MSRARSVAPTAPTAMPGAMRNGAGISRCCPIAARTPQFAPGRTRRGRRRRAGTPGCGSTPHLRAGINGVVLLGTGEALGLDETDSAAFLPALKPLFGDAGFELDAPHPARWYLRLPREAKLPAFASPGIALGDDVFEHAPEGPEARRWRR